MSVADHPGQEPQSAGAVLMVRPARFGCNPQTAPSNAFQADPAAAPENDPQRDALQEFHSLANALEQAGVDVLGEFAQQLDYDLMTFDAVDAGGRAVYHTNVLMAIGTAFAVVCSESIPNDAHRAAVLSKLRATGHEVVEITLPQMLHFAAN